MPLEIERKFLLQGASWKSESGDHIRQGYLCKTPDYSVRVRTTDDDAWITVKGRREGISRLEFEYPIPIEDARQMFGLCTLPLIEKIRYRIPHQHHVWEVDEFLGANAGLVVAEIELQSPDETFARPDWLGMEVTGDPRYLNANLAERPYTEWE